MKRRLISESDPNEINSQTVDTVGDSSTTSALKRIRIEAVDATVSDHIALEDYDDLLRNRPKEEYINVSNLLRYNQSLVIAHKQTKKLIFSLSKRLDVFAGEQKEMETVIVLMEGACFQIHSISQIFLHFCRNIGIDTGNTPLPTSTSFHRCT